MTDKVVWTEGLLLSQQHLQQWELLMQQKIEMRTNIIAPDHWGLVNLEIDEAALLNGCFRLKKCCAIYKNGYFIDYVAQHDAVLSCELSLTVGETTRIFLGVPINYGVAGITGYPKPKTSVAWHAYYKNIADLYDATREAEVIFAKLNLVLVKEQELGAKYELLPLAEVMTGNGKQLKIVHKFIPPVTHINSSPYLCELVQYYIDHLEAKISLLNEQRQYQENARYLLIMQTLQNSLVRFIYLQQHFYVHPRMLFLALLSLSSKLCVFSKDLVLRRLPNYEHTELTEKFSILHEIAHHLLGNLVLAKTRFLELTQQQEQIYVVENIEPTLFVNKSIILAIDFTCVNNKADLAVIKQVKAGPKSMLNQLINSALSGLGLRFIDMAQNDFVRETCHEYFYLQKSGVVWEKVVEEQSLAIFMPATFLGVIPKILVIDK